MRQVFSAYSDRKDADDNVIVINRLCDDTIIDGNNSNGNLDLHTINRATNSLNETL